jgi:hypothetical protein
LPFSVPSVSPWSIAVRLCAGHLIAEQGRTTGIVTLSTIERGSRKCAKPLPTRSRSGIVMPREPAVAAPQGTLEYVFQQDLALAWTFLPPHRPACAVFSTPVGNIGRTPVGLIPTPYSKSAADLSDIRGDPRDIVIPAQRAWRRSRTGGTARRGASTHAVCAKAGHSLLACAGRHVAI